MNRFPGTTISEDRDAMIYGRNRRMEAAHDRITAALCDIEESAWEDVAAENQDSLDDQDCDHAEARAAKLERLLKALKE